ncbi:heparan-alpha-glucosaminide N-acetyltransferase domain-containing protein [Luteococcus peritonei]|uniref:Heparan-alpha-glucosaminide N-acetyltransferase domain-containing protein n=1 Tax=Luteococcus peritonei TaxID=88874 RepID=A0ABW4RV83_9ACTN
MSDPEPGADRLAAPGRLAGVDLARGLAVLGMFAAHLLDLPELDWNRPATLPGLATGHASVLFALLAGVSLALVGTASRTDRGNRLRLACRALVIWALGLAVVGTGVPVEVILPAYGLLFLVATGLLGRSVTTLLQVATVLGLLGPPLVLALDEWLWPRIPDGGAWQDRLGWAYPAPVWACYLAGGMAVGLLLRHPARRTPKALAELAVAGALLAVLGHALLGTLAGLATATDRRPGSPAWWLRALDDAPHSDGIGEVVASSGLALLTLAACLLLCRTPMALLAWPLRAVGSMPLTAYVAHLLAWAGWLHLNPTGEAEAVAAFRALHPFWPTVALTLAACSLWTALLGRGPLEQLVRVLSGRLAGVVERPTTT